MHNINKVEQILIDALKEYSQNHPLIISNIDSGSLGNQFERGNGLTLTLDDGTVYEILIMETE